MLLHIAVTETTQQEAEITEKTSHAARKISLGQAAGLKTRQGGDWLQLLVQGRKLQRNQEEVNQQQKQQLVKKENRKNSFRSFKGDVQQFLGCLSIYSYGVRKTGHIVNEQCDTT